MDDRFLSEFSSPGSVYRGKPFWAWNGPLEPQELRRQVRLMHQMGLGGFFMHSRVGLDTEYLGKEWFECIRACIDEADKLKMEAWLYDEDRWPSGAAGGLVTRNPKYRMRAVWMDILDDPRKLKWNSDVLAAFVATLDGATARDVQPIARNNRPGPLVAGRSILTFTVRFNDCGPWYNGYTYLDTMSKEAVAKFIQVTHEAYRKNVKPFFGKTVPGIFTDEPNYGGDPDSLPWTDKLPAAFKNRYGYDLLPHLVELMYDVPGAEFHRTRWNFWDCVTHLFVTSFSKQIGQWCDKNGIQSTGHVLCEESLRYQTWVVGSAMRHYEYMQAPGMDLLTEGNREYTTAKQVSSMSHQFGWKWRLTETYGCTGWDFNFEGHKALGDWQAALGINLRCPHLSFYTMLGEAKRDYPASIFYQSPWWQLYGYVEDYFARIGVATTRGQEVRDLLVVHAIESMWVQRRHGWMKGNSSLIDDDHVFDRVTSSLLEQQIDFDYGDEEVLSRHAKVTYPKRQRGDSKTCTPEFKVAKAAYKAVLVPPLKTIRSTTLSLLEKFRAAGGLVVFAGEAPGLVDGLPSLAAKELAARCSKAPISGKGLADAVEKVCRRVSIATPDGLAIRPALYLLREDREAFYLFVCNTSVLPDNPDCYSHPLVRDRREAFEDVRIRGFADCKGSPIELDPRTGKRYLAVADRTAYGWEIRTSLPRIGTRLFVIPKQKGGKDPMLTRVAPLREVGKTPLGGERWDVQLSESNVLVLDRPEFRFGGGPWRGPMEILRVDRAVRDELKAQHRGGAMVQPWARPKGPEARSLPVTLAYKFDVKVPPTGDLFLAVERPETFRVAVNGQCVSADADEGWWVDRSLRRLRIDPATLRFGCNEITLAMDYDVSHSGLEMVYLLGNFGTRLNGVRTTLTAPVSQLALGDWTSQGLTFYSGNVAYRTKVSVPAEGKRLSVRVPGFRGSAVRVRVGGRDAGLIAWEPHELDVTDLLTPGENDLVIEVIGHRRNSHGPHHQQKQWPRWTGPERFVETGEGWYEGYNLVPCGLMDPPEVVLKE